MISHISASELAARLQSGSPPRLLDVREVGEHEFAAIPGSILIPLGQVGDRTGEIEAWKKEPVVVYCHHGVRSMHAIRQLHFLGFENLANLTGGIDAWSLEVDPAVPRY